MYVHALDHTHTHTT